MARASGTVARLAGDNRGAEAVRGAAAGAIRGGAAGAAGSQTRTLVPWPGADSRVAWPPCAWAMAATMARPSPLPPLSAASPLPFPAASPLPFPESWLAARALPGP